METSEDFRRRAARCIERSRTPKSELAKATWLDMAQFWLSLARQAERTGDGNEEESFAHDLTEDSQTNGWTAGSGDQDEPERYGPVIPSNISSNLGQQHNGGAERALRRH